MRSQTVKKIVLCFLIISILLIASLFGLRQLLFTSTKVSSNNIIVLENAHQGTTNWKIPSGKEASTEIQAYASATSISPGQLLTFYVSTQKQGTPYSIDIYRLGWYGGAGGRLMTSRANQIGSAQGYYDPSIHRLVGCTLCHIDTQTGLVEANWMPSYILAIPFDWITGIYLAKFTDINGMQTYVPFDVKGQTHSLYVVVTADTTYAAYNEWGGYSLYSAYNRDGTSKLVKATKVSFDRPYSAQNGSSQVLYMEGDAIHWLERQGYDLSYISSVDLNNDPVQLLNHHAYISLGHDEYWTKEMRDGVEYARDHGVGLAFLEADASYWQMRFESDDLGIPNRTIVCYKVQTALKDLARDPLYDKDNTRLTAQWRDPIIDRPENALIGIMYSDDTHKEGFAWKASSQANSPLLRETDLQPGESYGCNLIGYEWDRVFQNGATPNNLQILGTSPTIDNWNYPDISNTTYYIASSGAMVFATGSVNWTASLDSYRFYSDPLCAGHNPEVPGMQKLMTHVMDALIINHSSQLTFTPSMKYRAEINLLGSAVA